MYEKIALSLSLLALSSLPSQAAINFVFNFTDAPGVGFNASGQSGIDRRAGLNAAADIIEDLFVNYNATINIDVNGSQTNDTTLASAASNFNAPGTPGFGNRGDVARIILGLGDPSPGTADGIVDWNFQDFQWETASDFQPGELDMISTGAHELLHAVGFASDIGQNGNDAYGNTPGNPGNWVPFDQFVSDSVSSIISGADFALAGSRWNTASIGGTGSNGLFFNGPNAVAANGGNLVNLYSPSVWSGGSSGSHLDTDFFTEPNVKMMNHEGAVPEGLDTRDVSAIEIGILRDIGFTSVVPEPSSLALLFGSVALLAVRRRR